MQHCERRPQSRSPCTNGAGGLDATFYRTPTDAAAAPAEELAYVSAFDRGPDPRPDGRAVVDVKKGSADYGKLVNWVNMPGTGDELHHFGWNACSSALCHTGHDPAHLERRYLLVPGLRSSRIHVIDTQPDPRAPHIVRTIEASELADKAGYSRPHTLHCGPSGLYLSALGGAGTEGPGGMGIAVLDHDTFQPLELRPAHNPDRTYGFVNSVVSVADLSASIWVWHREGSSGDFSITKVIEIPAEPADASVLPPLLQGFGAVPPLATDIGLSVDDRFLYVSCWGTGELRQYDVSDPLSPVLTGSVHIGGIVRRTPHPSSAPPLSGGPQMVEVSRDGRRVYFTNSLYGAWDDQFYPDGVGSWLVKLDVDPGGGLAFDKDLLLTDFDGLRVHQVRLQGGDASSDSYCFS